MLRPRTAPLACPGCLHAVIPLTPPSPLSYRSLNGEAPTLTEWFGDLLPAFADYEATMGRGKLHAVRRKTYDIECNWKVRAQQCVWPRGTPGREWGASVLAVPPRAPSLSRVGKRPFLATQNSPRFARGGCVAATSHLVPRRRPAPRALRLAPHERLLTERHTGRC